jgi:hypothetical protein
MHESAMAKPPQCNAQAKALVRLYTKLLQFLLFSTGPAPQGYLLFFSWSIFLRSGFFSGLTPSLSLFVFSLFWLFLIIF